MAQCPVGQRSGIKFPLDRADADRSHPPYWREQIPRPQLPGLTRLAAAIAAVTILAFVALTSLAAAKSAKFHRGGLPSIGQITLSQQRSGVVIVSVPVTYKKALSTSRRGMETTSVTLNVFPRLKLGRPDGHPSDRTHDHFVKGDETIVDHFRLGREKSRWLLGTSRKVRGKLVRVDVQHLIRDRPGQPPLHEKDASLTLASSHRAKARASPGR